MPSLYVATTGSDASGDGSATNPFATLAHAQQAMRAGTVKTTVVEGGTYVLQSTLALTAADNGETFVAAAGQSAVLDGHGSLGTLVSLANTSGVTLSGLAFENAAPSSGLSSGALFLNGTAGTTITANRFVNCGSDSLLMIGATGGTIAGNEIDGSGLNGIEDQDGGAGNAITGNTINGAGAPGTTGGGLYLHGTDRETIAHNLVENTQGSGIAVESVGGYDGGRLYARNTATVVQANQVRATDLGSGDSGAIYVLDRTGQDTGIAISGNEVDGSGPLASLTGIYLDDYASGVSVTGNIVRNVAGRDVELHGGRNDAITGNILDTGTGTGTAVLLQSPPANVTPDAGPQGSTNDTVGGNIIVSAQAAPTAFTNLGLSPLPAIAANLYYDPAGSFATSGDSSPRLGNPLFTNAASNDYSLQAGSAAAQIGFQAIDQGSIGPVVSPPPEAPVPVPPTPGAPVGVDVGSGPDTIALVVSEDAWLGDARFTASVDGQQVGGTLTTTAIHGLGQTQTFTLHGTFSTGAHTLGVDFVNDAWGGTAATDRNLYVVSVSASGTTTAEGKEQTNNGTASYAVPATALPPSVPAPVPAPPPVPPPAPAPAATDQLVLQLSEDAYQGDAQANILVDGRQVAGPVTVTALHGAGQLQTVAIDGAWGGGSHTVGVSFINDAYAGTAATDRNLYVATASYDGRQVDVNAEQASNGTTNVVVAAGVAPIGTGPNQLVVALAEDAYQGDAQALVSVDGQQVVGPVTVTALRGSGASQQVVIDGNWGAGRHQVGVTFTNDAYGGSATTDRNLYVTGASYNGTEFAENILQAQTGMASFSVTGTAVASAPASQPLLLADWRPGMQAVAGAMVSAPPGDWSAARPGLLGTSLHDATAGIAVVLPPNS